MERQRKKNKTKVVGTKRKCACGCGKAFIVKSSNQKYSPNCSQSAYRKNNIRYLYEKRKQALFKKPRSKTKYPLHKCSRPDCKNKTTNRKLCDWCFQNAHNLPEVPYWGFITLTNETRATINQKFEEMDQHLMETQIIQYDSENYSQKELWGLVNECR